MLTSIPCVSTKPGKLYHVFFQRWLYHSCFSVASARFVTGRSVSNFHSTLVSLSGHSSVAISAVSCKSGYRFALPIGGCNVRVVHQIFSIISRRHSRLCLRKSRLCPLMIRGHTFLHGRIFSKAINTRSGQKTCAYLRSQAIQLIYITLTVTNMNASFQALH